ncbi:MAG: hypothetical protein OHK0015_53120 [Chloroflexi bacterium OHK40]
MTHFVTSFEEIGRAEGRREERQAIVLRQLNRKVGPLAGKLQARVAALSPETLLTLTARDRLAAAETASPARSLKSCKRV